MNKHEVTVHIWKNDERYESVLQEGGMLPTMQGFNTGHAALKLQEFNAEKGDYYYLSLYPDREFVPREVNGQVIQVKAGKIIGNTMPLRLGTGSLTAAGKNPKALGTSDPTKTDHTEMKKKPTTTYRFNSGLVADRILHTMKAIADNKWVWSLKELNCATAVACCLRAGGADPLTLYYPYTAKGWTPNRLGEWCQELVEKLGGEVKREDRRRDFYDID